MVNKVNLALFGSGYWGSKLATEYMQLHRENPMFNFVGIVDPDQSRLASIGSKLDLPSKMLFSDFEKCLSDPNITAIHVATPNETHFNIAYEALSQSKHVLLEKPMALNGRDAFKLARTAEKNGHVLLVGHIFRFNSGLWRAKEMIEKNAIGDVYYLNLNWSDYLDPLPKRDIIFDLMPHPVDILNYLTDEWPSSIYAQSESYRRPHEAEREDVAFITMEMPDKKSAEVILSWIQMGLKQRSVTVTGSNGTLVIDTITQDVTIYSRQGKNEISVTKNNTMKSMIEHFLKCINGIENPSNSSLVGAITVNVLTSARRSLSEKRAMKILE